jgi:hypothetical protein
MGQPSVARICRAEGGYARPDLPQATRFFGGADADGAGAGDRGPSSAHC